MVWATVIGKDDTFYEIVFYLHILTAIIGYGTVVLNGLRATKTAKLDLPERFAAETTDAAVSKYAQLIIYANFALGLLMVILSDNDIVAFDQSWLSLSMLLWIVAIGISHGLLVPANTKVLADLEAQVGGAEPGSTGVDLDGLQKRIAASGAVLNVLLVVILYLMVWKPGA